MIKIDRNMSQKWQIVSEIYNDNISVFVGFILWITDFFIWLQPVS